MALQNFSAVLGLNVGGNYAAIVSHWQTDVVDAETSFVYARDLATALFDPSVGDNLFTNLQDLLAEDCYISSIVTRRVSPTGGNSFAASFTPANYPGTFGGNMDAAQVAACSIWLTAANAGLNGKTFVPGVSEEAMENGRFTSGYITVHESWVTAFLDQTREGPNYAWIPVLKHGSPASFTAIKQGYLSADAGTQKRRRVPV